MINTQPVNINTDQVQTSSTTTSVVQNDSISNPPPATNRPALQLRTSIRVLNKQKREEESKSESAAFAASVNSAVSKKTDGKISIFLAMICFGYSLCINHVSAFKINFSVIKPLLYF